VDIKKVNHGKLSRGEELSFLSSKFVVRLADFFPFSPFKAAPVLFCPEQQQLSAAS